MSESNVKSGQGPKNPAAAEADRSHPAAPGGKVTAQIEKAARSPIPVHHSGPHGRGGRK